MPTTKLQLALFTLCLALLTACNSQGPRVDPAVQTETLAQDAPRPVQISDYLVDIYEDSKGHLWFGSINRGVGRYDGTQLTYLTSADGLPDNRVTSINEDRDGNFWFATESGLVKYDGDTFETFSDFAGHTGADVNRVTNVLIDKSGDFWVGTWGGIFRYDGEVFTKFDLPRPEVDTVWNQDTKDWTSISMIDSKGNVWFTVDAYGATKWDGKTFTHYNKKQGLPSNSVRTVAEDEEGNFWFGTRVSERDHPNPDKRFGAGGLSLYDGESFTHFPEYPGLSESDVYSIYADKSGNVWISTLSDGLYKYDGKEFSNFKPEQGENPIPFKGIGPMLEDSKGDFWIGCSGGLFRLDGDRVVNITQDGPWK